MEETVIDNEINETPKDLILEIMGWWERKRLLFNLIVIGIVGLTVIPIMVSNTHGISRVFSGPFIIQSIFYFIFINIAYCAGWGIQFLRYYFSKTQANSTTLNYFLFVIGTIFTALVTFQGYSSWL